MQPRIAEEIISILDARQVAEHYGFTPNRAGFIQCPFHQGDHTASLKLYPGDRGWCCFGCHKGGSVINFVMNLFDISYGQAILRLNADFGLGLSNEAPGRMAYSKALEARRAERREMEKLDAEWHRLRDELWRLKDDGSPEALSRIPYVEYELDEIQEKQSKKRK